MKITKQVENNMHKDVFNSPHVETTQMPINGDSQSKGYY